MRWILPLALLACAKQAPVTFDPTLPEQSTDVEAAPPRDVLEGAAGDLDPSLRAAALAMVLQLDWGDAWDARALGDPSPWVQRRAVSALAARGTPTVQAQLEAFAAQDHRAPVARAMAAIRAPSSAMAATMEAAWPREPAPWNQLPLALASLVNGDAAAQEPLARTLSTGELPMDVELVLEVGRSGEVGLVGALQQAQARVERELELPIAAARWSLGDGTAEEAFRKAVSGPDVERRLEALDILLELDRDQARGLIAKARNQGPELVAWYADLALAADSGQDPGVFERAAVHADREVRELGMRFAGQAVDGGTPHRRVVRAAEKALLQGLADPDDTVVIAAVQAVRALRLSAAHDELAPLLERDNARLRVEAAGTLLTLEAAGG